MMTFGGILYKLNLIGHFQKAIKFLLTDEIGLHFLTVQYAIHLLSSLKNT